MTSRISVLVATFRLTCVILPQLIDIVVKSFDPLTSLTSVIKAGCPFLLNVIILLIKGAPAGDNGCESTDKDDSSLNKKNILFLANLSVQLFELKILSFTTHRTKSFACDWSIELKVGDKTFYVMTICLRNTLTSEWNTYQVNRTTLPIFKQIENLGISFSSSAQLIPTDYVVITFPAEVTSGSLISYQSVLICLMQRICNLAPLFKSLP